nr:aryl hydrocarbon receptor nuclear translocator [Micromelalopha troglodyta]
MKNSTPSPAGRRKNRGRQSTLPQYVYVIIVLKLFLLLVTQYIGMFNCVCDPVTKPPNHCSLYQSVLIVSIVRFRKVLLDCTAIYIMAVKFPIIFYKCFRLVPNLLYYDEYFSNVLADFIT